MNFREYVTEGFSSTRGQEWLASISSEERKKLYTELGSNLFDRYATLKGAEPSEYSKIIFDWVATRKINHKEFVFLLKEFLAK